MDAVLACIVILAVIGLGFFALDKIKPGWFRVQAGAGQRFIFIIEMGQGDKPAPCEERRELEPGRDKPGTEARRERRDSSDGGEDNAAALPVTGGNVRSRRCGKHRLRLR